MGQEPPKTPLVTVDIIIECDAGSCWSAAAIRRSAGRCREDSSIRVKARRRRPAARPRKRRASTSSSSSCSASTRIPSAIRAASTRSARCSWRARPGRPVGGDDAAEARVFALDALPPDIAFDHPTDHLRLPPAARRPGAPAGRSMSVCSDAAPATVRASRHRRHRRVLRGARQLTARVSRGCC